MAGATVVNPSEGSLENRVSVMAAQVIDAWRTSTSPAPCPAPAAPRCPPSFAAGILPIELVLHGWDLAQGSGQRLHISDELVAYVRGLAETVVPGGRGAARSPTRSPRPRRHRPSTASRPTPAAPRIAA